MLSISLQQNQIWGILRDSGLMTILFFFLKCKPKSVEMFETQGKKRSYWLTVIQVEEEGGFSVLPQIRVSITREKPRLLLQPVNLIWLIPDVRGVIKFLIRSFSDVTSVGWWRRRTHWEPSGLLMLYKTQQRIQEWMTISPTWNLTSVKRNNLVF